MKYGLIFDVDGILADTETLVALATIDMFRELHGFEPEVEDFRPFIGTGPHRYVEGVAEQYGVSIDLEKAVATRQEKFLERLGSEYIGFPGANALIEAAAESPDWKLAIATSSVRSKAEASLRAAHAPIEHFDAFISGDMVTRRKPHPDIYLLAAEGLGLPPTRCAGVEDAVTGVESVLAAGMVALAVSNSFPSSELSKAHRVVSSLEEVTLLQLKELIENNMARTSSAPTS